MFFPCHLETLTATLLLGLLLRTGRTARLQDNVVALALDKERTPVQSLCGKKRKCCASREAGDEGSFSCLKECKGKHRYELAGRCTVADLAVYVESKMDEPATELLERFLDAQNAQFELSEGHGHKQLVELAVDTADTVFVVGDLHAALDQLLVLMKRIAGILDPNADEYVSKHLVCRPGVYYLFLGDYVDRGEYDVETATLVLAYRMLCPFTANFNGGVVLLRGNHEDKRINQKYTFAESTEDMGKVFDLFCSAWDTLPIAATINRKVLLVHGGLAPWLLDVADYAGLRAKIASSSPDQRKELAWNDPYKGRDSNGSDDGWHNNARGSRYKTFDKRVVDRFTRSTGIEVLIRGHQVQQNGHSISLDAVHTVHTMANYNNIGNSGAFAQLGGGTLDIYLHKIQSSFFWGTSIQEEGELKLKLDLSRRQSLLQQSQPKMSPLAPVGLQDILDMVSEDTCKNISLEEQHSALHEAAKTFKRLADEADENLAMGLEIEIDELGEAAALDTNPMQKLEECCQALLKTRALGRLLKAQAAIQDSDAEVLQREVDMKRACVESARLELEYLSSEPTSEPK